MKWEVTNCQYDRKDGIVRLEERETEEFWNSERSPGEGASVTCYDPAEEMTRRHLNVFEHRCEIRLGAIPAVSKVFGKSSLPPFSVVSPGNSLANQFAFCPAFCGSSR